MKKQKVHREMNFSRRGRALVGQEMFHLLDRAQIIEREGRHVYHLELGEPKPYPPGRVINRTIISLLNSEVGYSPSRGVSSLREKLAAYCAKTAGREILMDHIVISPANMLIYQILDLLCEGTDTVSVFTPGFPTYIAATKYIGAKLHYVPLVMSSGFNLTRNSIDRALSVNPKLLIVNSGNNPTGAVYDESVLRYLLDQAIKKDCWVLSDETYSKLSFQKPYFSLLGSQYERCIVLSSFSKIFCVPGYRIGYAVADSRVVEKIGLSSSTLYSCLPVFVQEGIAEGIPIIDEFTDNRKRYYRKLRDECMKILSRSSNLVCVKPESGFYLLIDIRKLKIDDRDFSTTLLNKYSTAVTPGTSFGCKGFIRASICGDTVDVKQGLRQLVLFANSFHKNTRKGIRKI